MTMQTVPTLAEIRQWPATVSVPTACASLGIGRSHGYELVRRGEFPVRTVALGRSCRVITADLLRLLEGQVDTA